MAHALAISAYWNDWLDVLLRWLHVVAAIVWIGTSFYFVALDNHLRPPGDRRFADEGVGGESWEIHGGGFYRIQKFSLVPGELPDPLHWFKWEAYTTWLAGFALLVTLYYFHPREYLIDPAVADLEPWQAIAISAGLLLVAWLVYDALCRLTSGREGLLAVLLIVLVMVAAYGACHLFSGRGAYLQVGAMLGTIMVANVFFVIIPAHRALIRAKEEGRAPDPADGARGKQRSVHNNYFTLPVVFAMLSNHFSVAYAHSYAWAILVAFMLIGAAIRLFFNLRHAGRNVWAIPAVAGAALIGLAVAMRPSSAAAPAAGSTPVSFTRVQGIVDERCVPCHSQHPSNSSFSSPPLGITFDTAAQIKARGDQIVEQAVTLRAMPLNNATHMTDEERAILGQWNGG